MSNSYYYQKEKNGIDSLILAEEPIPKPGRAQVLIRVYAVSLNYRDLAIVAQKDYPAPTIANLTPCSDGAGEIVEVGEQVTSFKKGDRVCGTFIQSWLGGERGENDGSTVLGGSLQGMLTHYRVLDESGLVHIPAHLSYEEASTLPCAAVTAWNSMFEGPQPLRSGCSVLLIGTGGVSIAALQLAKAAGVRVIITSSSNDKLQIVKKLGADEGINYNETKDWEKKVLELTGGKGVDHVVLNTGTGQMLKPALATRLSGSIGIVGILDQSDEEGAGRAIMNRSIIVRPIGVGSREMFKNMNQSIDFHKIKPHIDKVFPFSQAKDAFKYLESQKHIGKVVIKID